MTSIQALCRPSVSTPLGLLVRWIFWGLEVGFVAFTGPPHWAIPVFCKVALPSVHYSQKTKTQKNLLPWPISCWQDSAKVTTQASTCVPSAQVPSSAQGGRQQTCSSWRPDLLPRLVFWHWAFAGEVEYVSSCVCMCMLEHECMRRRERNERVIEKPWEQPGRQLLSRQGSAEFGSWACRATNKQWLEFSLCSSHSCTGLAPLCCVFRRSGQSTQ